MFWCSVNSFIPAKKSFGIYQSTAWPGRHIGRIMNHNIPIQWKTCVNCLSKCNWFVVWLRMTSEFFHPLSHILRKEKAVGRISLFPRSAIINGYCLSRSAILSYTPIVVQNGGLKVTSSWFSALCKYIEMSSELLSTIRDDWDVRFE